MLTNSHGELETGEPRHLDVGDNDVGAQPLRLGPGAEPVCATTDHLDIILESKKRRQSTAHHRLIFSKQDSDHVCAAPLPALHGVSSRGMFSSDVTDGHLPKPPLATAPFAIPILAPPPDTPTGRPT